MRKELSSRIAVLLTVVGLCIPTVIAYADERPDATIELSGGAVAAGLGFSWGSGTLTYKGRAYPIEAYGFDVGDLGVSDITASARVYNLKKLEDFDGNFTGVGAGATAMGGGSALVMENQNGVRVSLNSTSQGVQLTTAVDGVKMKVKR